MYMRVMIQLCSSCLMTFWLLFTHLETQVPAGKRLLGNKKAIFVGKSAGGICYIFLLRDVDVCTLHLTIRSPVCILRIFHA